MFYWEKLTVENDFKYILLGIHDFNFFILPTAIMEKFAFKVGVGPNGPQQYLIGLIMNVKKNWFNQIKEKIIVNRQELFIIKFI